jgi:hypothetical protein
MLLLTNLLLLILIVEIGALAKLFLGAFADMEGDFEKAVQSIIEIRNAVVKVKPGDVPQP